MKKTEDTGYLPLCRAEAQQRGWGEPDFVYVSGDAYVDHPSFGAAIISRVLADAGYSVAILAQPDFRSADAFREYGRPRLGFLVSAGNLDSMVANYTVAKKRRGYDYYSPGGKAGSRPDRATIVYCNRIREAYGDVPIILGGVEASLRRFAHYDYWEDRVRNSILVDSGADILTYGMGENILLRIASLLKRGVPVGKIHDVRGTVYLTNAEDKLHFPAVGGWNIEELKTDKRLYAEAFAVQYRENDHIRGRAVTERYGDRILVQNPPMPPLEREELDRVYALPYMRSYHPSYEKDGGIPAIREVRFSITHNRGCFGGCAFCAIAFHQGRSVRSRSIESVVKEAELLTTLPDFKGYIHDIGGPTANFRYPACDKQLRDGVCPNRRCLTPTPCKNLKADHREYTELLDRVKSLPGVKKVFIRSGIRFDYLLADRDETFFRRLVRDHVSGQLKVAPEHCSDGVLALMGKPSVGVYDAFRKRFGELCDECGMDQYLIPYLMSSHPGSRLSDAVELALYLKSNGCAPDQVQDFYPTPSTASTVMYYTGIDPMSGKEVYIANDPHEKKLQRALLQYNRPENASLVREALVRCGREDLIGYGRGCLVKPDERNASRRIGEKDYGSERNREGKTRLNRLGRAETAGNKHSEYSGKFRREKKRSAGINSVKRSDRDRKGVSAKKDLRTSYGDQPFKNKYNKEGHDSAANGRKREKSGYAGQAARGAGRKLTSGGIFRGKKGKNKIREAE